MELYKKYRPKTLEEVLGQDAVVSDLKARIKKGNIPHALMFHGPSGTGKTTLARILKEHVGCKGPLNNGDFCQLNCATLDKPLEEMKSLEVRARLNGMHGGTRVWVLEEAQALSRATFAQQALLMTIEDNPPSAYFFICTTDPDKIHKAIKTRCTSYKLELVKPKSMKGILGRVLEGEEAELSDEVIDKIVSLSDGSPRLAINLLEKALGAESEEEQLEVISKSEQDTQAIELARALMNPRAQWSDITKVLKQVDEEPESLRAMVLGYANSVLLGGGKLASRAYAIICAFEGSFYEGRKASLTRACWEVVGSK